MNFTLNEIKDYVKELELIKCKKNLLIFCPSFTYLKYFNGKNYYLGSQNVSDHKMGPLTGEVSVEQLKSLGVTYIIVGHSERRNILKENLKEIQRKVSLCLENGITPILCIGEKYKERDRKEEVLRKEIDSAFIDNQKLEKIIIAYEPIWSIGTGLTPTEEEIRKTLSWIKKYIKETYCVNCKTLYGGSVNEETIYHLKKITSIDGYLIGGTSLNIEALKKVIEVLEV